PMTFRADRCPTTCGNGGDASWIATARQHQTDRTGTEMGGRPNGRMSDGRKTFRSRHLFSDEPRWCKQAEIGQAGDCYCAKSSEKFPQTKTQTKWKFSLGRSGLIPKLIGQSEC